MTNQLYGCPRILVVSLVLWLLVLVIGAPTAVIVLLEMGVL